MLTSLLLLVHLLSFAAYLGAGFAQLHLMKRSAGAEPLVRDAYEKLSAGILTKIELPAIMGSVVSGIGFLAQNGALIKMGWLHPKLLCVAILLVLTHFEMFNARKIVKARAAGGKDAEIEGRKKRHGIFGKVGAVLVVAILFLVTFVRLGAFK